MIYCFFRAFASEREPDQYASLRVRPPGRATVATLDSPRPSPPRALGFRARFGATTARGWRAMFFPSEFEHSLIPHAGSAWARSPWEAVQRAAADTFDRLHSGEPAAPD